MCVCVSEVTVWVSKSCSDQCKNCKLRVCMSWGLHAVTVRCKYCLLQADFAAGNPYVISITNDLYQPSQPTETVITNRMMRQTVGAAEAAAAKAAASAAAAAAVGPSVKAGASSKISAHSVTGLVGLHQVCVCLNI